MAHEIGHYFNLMHPWGGTMGGCNEDDGVADTPLQKEPSGSCTFPLYDTCTTSGNGLMYVNYMDYTPSDCVTMFTVDQKARMLAALNGPRSGLVNNNVCDATLDVSDNELNKGIRISYINELNNFEIHTSNGLTGEVEVNIFNMIGQKVHAESFVVNPNITYKIDLSEKASGLYIVRLTLGGMVLTKKVQVK